MILATIICVLSCALLVFAEHKHAKPARAMTKAIASLAFVAVAALAMSTNGAPSATWSEYQDLILLGLIFGVIGDLALLGGSSRAFLVGLGAFLLGHIAYVVAFAQLAPPGKTWASPFIALPIAVGLGALAHLWLRLGPAANPGGSMRVPVIGYVIAIVTMMIAAIAAAGVPGYPLSNRILLVTGAALFFASDLAVARDRFAVKSFSNKAWGLPAYYGGQLCIAWSLAP